MYSKYLKRIFDILVCIFLLFLFSPLIFILIFVLRLYNGKGGVFFTQERPGKDNKIFKLYKFKTMVDTAEEEGKILPSFKRLTPIGAFIRKFSIDELPQLLNVLNGDMSLVGPRPLLSQYLTLYSKEQLRRHVVRPGITGWAQVNGRNTISWSKKFEYDVYYVNNISIYLDIYIIFLTIRKVFTGSGVNANSSQIVETFNGKN